MRAQVSKLPEKFIERLRCLFPARQFDAIANTFTQVRPTTFRANTLKADARTLHESLQRQRLMLQPVGWYRDAFILRKGTLRELQKTDEYNEGRLYVQNLSSMVPPLILDPQPGESILDMTAAPGSKTTQIAAMMQGEGRLTANDNNRVRFFKLKANVESQGAANVILSQRYGESFGKYAQNQFDRVLLDAPCSAEGRFYVHKPASFSYWKPNKVKEMSGKQKKLIAAAVHCLRPGGTLVYSTCTFAPEENEGVLDWALKKFGDRIELVPIALNFPNQTAGMTRWAGKELDPSVKLSRRILPNQAMEAFFVAKILKKRDSVKE